MRIPWCSIVSAVLLVSLTQAIPVEKIDDNGRAEASSPGSAENVSPTAYTIKLEPHLAVNDFTFNGQSLIDVNVGGPTTNKIVLHTGDLEIKDESTSLVNIKSGATMKLKTQTSDKSKQLWTIEFSDEIATGDYTLKLAYTGTLKEEAKGFYRVKKQIDGQNVWEALTKFKPSYAQYAFPCFNDTPTKARFTISIKPPKNYVAESTALGPKKSIDDEDKSWVHFATSDPMSTNDIDFKVVYAKPDVRPDPATTSTTTAPTTSTTAAPTTSTTAAPTTSTTADPTTSTTAPPTTSTTVAPTTSSTAAPTTSTTAASVGSTTVASVSSTTAAPTTSTTAAPTTSTTAAPTTSTTAAPTTSTTAASVSSTTVASASSTTVASVSSTTEESGSSTTEESGSSTTEESGSSTTEESASEPTGAASTTGAANISLPTLPLTIFAGLLVRLVAQAL